MIETAQKKFKIYSKFYAYFTENNLYIHMQFNYLVTLDFNYFVSKTLQQKSCTYVQENSNMHSSISQFHPSKYKPGSMLLDFYDQN